LDTWTAWTARRNFDLLAPSLAGRKKRFSVLLRAQGCGRRSPGSQQRNSAAASIFFRQVRHRSIGRAGPLLSPAWQFINQAAGWNINTHTIIHAPAMEIMAGPPSTLPPTCATG